MKSRTLSAMAVAAALGFSANAFAGYEVVTPASPNESAPSAMLQHTSSHQTRSSMSDTHASSVDPYTGNIGALALSDGTDWSASYDQMAEASDGASPDAYMVSWTPVSIDGLDYYLIDTEPLSLMADDELAFFSDGSPGWTSGDELAFATDEDALRLSTSDQFAFTQEDAVATTLANSPVEDTAEVG
jgi:hypothetical protein